MQLGDALVDERLCRRIVRARRESCAAHALHGVRSLTRALIECLAVCAVSSNEIVMCWIIVVRGVIRESERADEEQVNQQQKTRHVSITGGERGGIQGGGVSDADPV